MTLSGRKHKVTTSMRRLSPDASSPWSVGRSDERCERNVHSTYFHTKPSVSERLYGLRYHLRPLFHLYITHISQSHDPGFATVLRPAPVEKYLRVGPAGGPASASPARLIFGEFLKYESSALASIFLAKFFLISSRLIFLR